MKTNQVRNFYNTVVKDKLKYEYEYNRWFKNSLLKAGYEMTYSSLERQLHNLTFKNYLEVGPGPGTWTKLFLEKNREANYQLVDISQEMINIAKDRLSDYNNIVFTVSDFTDFSVDQQYDFFFSSRAIEYMPDKEKVVHNIFSLLKNGGEGIIITKTPKYLRSRLLGRQVPELHRNQIKPRDLKLLLQKVGFINVRLYSAVMNFPMFRSANLSKVLYKVFGSRKLNLINQLLAESYLIRFRKL